MLTWQSLMDVNQNYFQKVGYPVCIAKVFPKRLHGRLVGSKMASMNILSPVPQKNQELL